VKEKEMSSDRAPDSLVSAWQEQPTTGFRMVPSDFARKLRRDLRWSRPAFGIWLVFFAVLAIVGGAKLFSATDPILQVGHSLSVLAVAFFVGQVLVLRRRVRAARFDVDRTTVPSLAAARKYLDARRAFHSGRWLWSRVIVLFPVVPVLSYGQLRGDSFTMQGYLTGVLVPWIALIVFAVFIVQHGAARSYQRLLRELDDIERHSPLERYMASHEQWKEPQGDE
jgi:uncharacterized membrane protein